MRDNPPPQPNANGPALLRIALYFLIIMAPLALAAILNTDSGGPFIFNVGLAFPLVGFAIIAMQPVLAARLKWAERPFGQDMVYRFHMSMAILAGVLILLHPLTLAAGGLGGRLIYGVDVSWLVWLGRAGLVALLAQIVISAFRMRLHVEFQRWLKVHNVLALTVFIGGFVHSLLIGPDIQTPAVRAAWVLLFLAGFVGYAYNRIGRWLYNRARPYEVIDVKQEVHNVWTVKMRPADGREIYNYVPGQFHFIIFYRDRGLPTEEHHWTISSSPTEKGFVQSSIKESGDFTKTIGQTRVGDKAGVQGAYGRFSYVLHPEEKELVFISGGIGITPFRAMLRHMADTGAQKDILLIFGNRTERDIAFREELDEISKGGAPRLKVIHVLEHPEPSWKGETGRLNPDRIRALIGPDLKAKAFYVCAPPVLADMAINTLKGAGVDPDRIHEERFWFI